MRKNGNWRVAKKPVLSPVVIPQSTMLKLLIDGVEREGPIYRRRVWSESVVYQKLYENLGETVVRVIKDRLAVEREIETCRHQAGRIVENARSCAEKYQAEYKRIQDELCNVLGVPTGTNYFALRSAVRELNGSKEDAGLKDLTRAVQQAVENYGYKEQQ